MFGSSVQPDHYRPLPPLPSLLSAAAASPTASPTALLQGAVNTDKLYSAYHYSHPPLVERLAAIDAGMKKAS